MLSSVILAALGATIALPTDGPFQADTLAAYLRGHFQVQTLAMQCERGVRFGHTTESPPCVALQKAFTAQVEKAKAVGEWCEPRLAALRPDMENATTEELGVLDGCTVLIGLSGKDVFDRVKATGRSQ